MFPNVFATHKKINADHCCSIGTVSYEMKDDSHEIMKQRLQRAINMYLQGQRKKNNFVPTEAQLEAYSTSMHRGKRSWFFAFMISLNIKFSSLGTHIVNTLLIDNAVFVFNIKAWNKPTADVYESPEVVILDRKHHSIEPT